MSNFDEGFIRYSLMVVGFVIARSERRAIHSHWLPGSGLLRFARNDGFLSLSQAYFFA